MRKWALGFLVSLAAGICGQPGPVQVPSPPSVPAQVTPTAFPVLSEKEAGSAHQAGVLFLDARPRMDFILGHIPGAVSLPLHDRDFEDRLWDFLASPQGKATATVVVYCSGCCSTDAIFLAVRLQEAGFKQVKHYKDGFPGWARAERPISRDPLH